MKTNLALAGFFFASAAAVIAAAPLTSATAVHVQPDESSLTIQVLNAGTQPTLTASQSGSLPSGWVAVELPGPFEAFVKNGDIMKSLDVKVGAPVYLTPKAGAPELTKIEAADRTNITGLHGKWTQIRLEKRLVGYIRVNGVASYAMPANGAMETAASPAQAPLVDASPMTPIAYGTTAAGHPAATMNLDSGSSSLPRLIQGKFVSTRSAFKPRRPYDWALNDDAGDRYAYLDVSRLLLTEQIEKYIGHTVVVYGAAKSVPGGRDIVIEVESLQLK